jgi:hypothetical protein
MVVRRFLFFAAFDFSRTEGIGSATGAESCIDFHHSTPLFADWVLSVYSRR